MNRFLSLLPLIVAVLVLVLLLGLHGWLLLAVALHLRTVAAGILPFLAFWPWADRLIMRLAKENRLEADDRTLYAAFGSVTLGSACAFGFLTLHIAYPAVLQITAGGLLVWHWGWWRDLLQQTAQAMKRRGSASVPSSEKIFFTVALLLAGAAAVMPPLDYDAHEYHLPVPEQYLKTGGWQAFPYNVYAAFPMNVELLYLWPLSAGSTAGCTVMNLLFALITALGAWRLSRIWGLPRESLLVPVVFLATGLVVRLIAQGSIDLASSASAMVLLVAYERFREDRRYIDAVMMALALGYAFGSKYIAALSIGFPFLALLLADAGAIRKKQLLVSLLTVWTGGLALFLPWAVRNAVLYHNPFYPLLADWLGGTPAFFDELFRRAHAAPSADWLATAGQFLALPVRKSFVESLPMGFSALWLLGIPALLQTPRNHPAFRAMVFLAAAYLAWFFATQRNDRFLASLLPLMALAAAYSVYPAGSALRMEAFTPVLRRLVCGVVAFQLWAVANVLVNRDTAGYLMTPGLEEDYLAERLPHFRAIDWINCNRDALGVRQVLFIGEAQSYGAQFEAIAPTVFNHHPLEQGLDRSVSHILYNGYELDRLRKGYGPLGWKLGDALQAWIEAAKVKNLKPVFDAYPQNPGRIVVYEVK
ncbi:MAG: hypothetical protein ACE15F_07720 [bacterium]